MLSARAVGVECLAAVEAATFEIGEVGIDRDCLGARDRVEVLEDEGDIAKQSLDISTMWGWGVQSCPLALGQGVQVSMRNIQRDGAATLPTHQTARHAAQDTIDRRYPLGSKAVGDMVQRTAAMLAFLAVAPAAQAASFELIARASQSPTVAEWRHAYTVRVLIELVSAADETNPDATPVVARDVSLQFRPTRVVRRAEVLGYPVPKSGQAIDLFIGNASSVLLHLETAPTSEGQFRLGELRVGHAPFGADSVVEVRRDLWVTFVIDPETRVAREAKEAEEAAAAAEAAAEAAAVEGEAPRATGEPAEASETDEGEPGDLEDIEPEPTEPQTDPRVEARAAEIEAAHARTRSHMGNPAAGVALVDCLRERPFNLVIDPGHDVDDPRANRVWEEFSEFELNDNFVERLRSRVSAGLPRLRASLSRERDEALPLPERVRAIAAKKPDLVVSIHHDNVRWSRQNAKRVRGDIVRSCDDHLGFSVYVGTARGNGDEARRAGRFLADGLLAAGRLPGRFYAWGDFEHGVYTGDGLYLLRNLTPPTVLVELGYMCNPADLKLVQSRRFAEQQARVFADAIRRYVASSHCSTPLVP
jgi:N-acetylmuramoyl-L-alanine amidase